MGRRAVKIGSFMAFRIIPIDAEIGCQRFFVVFYWGVRMRNSKAQSQRPRASHNAGCSPARKKNFAFNRTRGELLCQSFCVFFSLIKLLLPLAVFLLPIWKVSASNLTIQASGNGTISLTWNSSATGPVNVERSLNLSSWSVVSNGNSNGTFTEARGNATKAFYRLVPSFSPDTMVSVQGNASQSIPNLFVSNTETTWGEWKRVRNWATANGYDLTNVGAGQGNDDRQPVQNVNWFDVLKWCNAKSEMESRTPVYAVNGSVYKSGQSVPAMNLSAGGYRLPSEAEWAWAASGGILSQGTIYIYSGSNTANDVAWYDDNSGGGPKPVGTKAANELSLFDMSGNILEWCWDEPFSGTRGLRGGSWALEATQCTISFGFDEFWDTRAFDIGFRPVRNLAP